jgi:hypothetical protein
LVSNSLAWRASEKAAGEYLILLSVALVIATAISIFAMALFASDIFTGAEGDRRTRHARTTNHARAD